MGSVILKFEELNKKEQDSRISYLEIQIEEAAESDNIKDFKFPTYEEYASFFNKLDGDYHVENNIVYSAGDYKPFGIKFQDGKTIIEVMG